MPVLYMNCYSEDADGGLYVVPLSTLIVSCVAQWTLPNLTATRQVPESDTEATRFLDVVLVKAARHDGEPSFSIPANALVPFFPTLVHSALNLPNSVRMCTSPSVIPDSSKLLCVSGLCGVLRFILKASFQAAAISLLGFRKSCLMACAEVSVWTKFCEVDLIQSTKEFIVNSENCLLNQLPNDLSRFEGHMRYPLRTHNIGKKEHRFVQEFNRLALEESKSVQEAEYVNVEGSKVSLFLSNDAKLPGSEKQPVLAHDYAEDVDMTLADLVILVCIHQMFIRTGLCWSSLHQTLPTVMNWYQRMTAHEKVRTAFLSCGMTPICQIENEIEKQQLFCTFPICSKSLYKRDVQRYNPSSRVYTKQNGLQTIIDMLQSSSITPEYTNDQVFENMVNNWDDLPKPVHPSFGDLPEIRLKRKCEQLQNMANAICSIASEGNTIVDFCSGGGHLGILLAFLLPKCHVILIENKEASVDRAALRASTLPNTTVIQCNLDYFQAKFDVGVALHACGMATDLVLQRCMDVGASFAVCPCCYGGVRDTHLLSYPRSQKFRNLGLTSEEYYFLGHAADQTHENGHKNEQGKYCMGLVDTDRKYEAESAGYQVRLYAMKPANCTPKHNILLGVKME